MAGLIEGQFSFVGLLGVVFLAAFVIGVVLWKLGLIGSKSPGSSLPASAQNGCKVSRRIEALLLLLIAGVILVFTATNRSTNGLLLMLDELDFKFAAVNAAIAAGAALVVLLAAVFCLFGKTKSGAVTAAVALCAYGIILNGPSEFIKDAGYTKIPYTIIATGADVEGARLWVNGVELGELPYKTTLDEFEARVPRWPEEPKEPEEGPDTEYDIHYSDSSKPRKRPLSRWIKFSVPDRPDENRGNRTYYARVRLGDEWAVYGEGGGSGGSGGGNTYSARSDFRVRYPERERRLEMLVDKLRLADYKPSPEWFEAMETYNSDGLIALYRAMDKEPQMDDVIDEWAKWKYRLGRVVDAETALDVFDEISAEAMEKGFYQTDSIAGRAVELIIPKLKADVIAARAVDLIRSRHFLQWNRWQNAGSWQFGHSESQRGFYTAGGGMRYEGRGGSGGKMQINDYPLVHAVWKLDMYLDRIEPNKQNVIEEKVVPVFMAYNYKSVSLLRLAELIDAEQAAGYAVRQNYREDVKVLPYNQRVRPASGGEEVNGWLYLLANLDCPTGKKFRLENEHLVMNLADKIVVNADPDDGWDSELDFLFIDFDGTENSLAWKYWNQFLRKVKVRRVYEDLPIKFGYLNRLEPLATVDMYLKAWRSASMEDIDFRSALTKFKGKFSEEKRLAIIETLKAEIERDISNVKPGGAYDDPKRMRETILKAIDIFGLNDEKRRLESSAKNIYEQLDGGKGYAKPAFVKQWLANEAFDHPLVAMLAGSDKPELRMLVFGAIKTHPVPANREILRKLLEDSDESVRKAASETAAELKELADLQCFELVS